MENEIIEVRNAKHRMINIMIMTVRRKSVYKHVK